MTPERLALQAEKKQGQQIQRPTNTEEASASLDGVSTRSRSRLQDFRRWRARKTPERRLDLDLVRTMYSELHSEINARLDLRQSITTFALLVAASLFGLGLQSWANAVTVLCYPILALFLALMWGQHDSKIGQIAAYLREIEDHLLQEQFPGWERWRRRHFQVKHYHIELPAKGVFLASEILAMVIGLARFLSQDMMPVTTSLFVLLMVADLAALILTNLALRHYRERSVTKGGN